MTSVHWIRVLLFSGAVKSIPHHCLAAAVPLTGSPALGPKVAIMNECCQKWVACYCYFRFSYPGHVEDSKPNIMEQFLQ